MSDPLYKNSFFMILNSFSNAFFGLTFWVITARLYSSYNMGIATALISTAAIIGSLSSFGLSNGIIRFLPESNDRSLLFNSILNTSLFSTLFFGIIYLTYIGIFSPALKFLVNSSFTVLFLFFLVFQMTSGIVNVGLIALRKAEFSFAQNLGLSFRILLLIPLSFYGIIGIFGSLGMSFVISSLLGIFFLYKQGISVKPIFSKKLVKNITSFSLANYTVDLFVMAQSSILPILILNVIGAKEAAHFYVAFSFVSLLYAIPNAVFMSMFVEGSHGEPIMNNLLKSLSIVGLLMIPLGLIIYLWGDVFLSIFSKEYSQSSFEILKLLVLSSVFVTFNAMFIATKKIQKDIKSLIGINALLFFSIITFSYYFMLQYGTFGVGMGWIFGQGLTVIVTGMILSKDKNFIKLRNILKLNFNS